MYLVVPELISPQLASSLVNALDRAHFLDGARTAGANRPLKNNLESADYSQVPPALLDELVRVVRTDRRLGRWAMPRASAPMLFNRYDVGMYYRDHVDTAIAVIAGQFHRGDISMTIFLAPPESYDGGELVIENDPQRTFKLPPGHAIAYRSGLLHRVNEVTRGRRLAAVTWIESLVRDYEERELIYDLAMSRDALGDSVSPEILTLMSKCVVNLERMFIG